jgi:hypothetical protein
VLNCAQYRSALYNRPYNVRSCAVYLTVLHCTLLHRTLYCTVYHTVPYYTVHHTVLHRTVQYRHSRQSVIGESIHDSPQQCRAQCSAELYSTPHCNTPHCNTHQQCQAQHTIAHTASQHSSTGDFTSAVCVASGALYCNLLCVLTTHSLSSTFNCTLSCTFNWECSCKCNYWYNCECNCKCSCVCYYEGIIGVVVSAILIATEVHIICVFIGAIL